MAFVLKKQKGQIALEFMLLLLFILVFISATVIPAADLGARTLQEIERLGQARIASEKIVNTLNRLQSQTTGAKQTINVFVPSDTNILCSTSQIGFQFALQGIPATPCEGDGDGNPLRCTKMFDTQTAFLACNGFPIEGKRAVKVIIERSAQPNQTMVSVQ